MGELMVEVRASSTGVDEAAAAEATDAYAPPPPPPPPAHPRRPRVREVSSRFMSPVVSSSSSNSGDHFLPVKSPLHKHNLGSTPIPNHADHQARPRSSSANRRRRQLDMEPLSCSDENRTTDSEPPAQIQSSETPFPLEQVPNTLRRQRSTKLLKENIGGRQFHHPPPHHSLLKSGHGKGGGAAFSTPARPDTPMLSASLDRTMSSTAGRYRLTQQRSANIASSAAAKLLQSSVMSLPSQSSESTQDANSTSQDGRCSVNALPHDGNHNRLSSSIQSLPDLRSSMSETDMLPTVSGRLRGEKNGIRGGGSGSANSSTDSLKFSFPNSRYMSSPFNSAAEGGEKGGTTVSKTLANSMKMGGPCLPPVPPCASTKSAMELKKAKKVSSHQEDVHSLKLLYNRYMQWRYANARAQVSLQAQQRETETKVNSLRVKMSELYDSVTRKRTELGILQRTKTLSTILEAQVPYLEQWSALEEDYSISVAESIQALLNASIQLPLGANVRVDVKELQEALNSAMKVMEIIVSQVQHLVPKAEKAEILISELARIAGGERALVEECGDLLSRTFASQVDECSLRSQIIQLHRTTCATKDNVLMRELEVNN
ncbi:protein ENDOSPERM DEFECTIVE 1-like [Humulus lupulus]|uniref:protein ENDOSPERM DEFECTIVE 1-like n=1 Tax=Humulus lupulus TaxID=3486 RepID=UPI002B4074C3|nr:protein ENDOSPERM DEFECTIVE 1-like [Humulus lupulus]